MGNKINMAEAGYICEYGIRHGTKPVAFGHEFKDCNCFEHYGGYTRFISYLKDKGYEIDYPQDITQDMREQFLKDNIVDPPIKKMDGDFYLCRMQRQLWTENKLKEISVEELLELKNEAVSRLTHSISKGLVSKKFIEQYTYVLLRNKYFNK